MLLTGLGPPAEVRADDTPEVAYDIYRLDDSLAVLLDLTPLITARAVERLEDGVDLLVHCELRLEVPRRFWGTHQVAGHSFVLKVGYHPVTEEYLIESSDEAGSEPKHFLSLAALYAHLRDSVECCLAVLDSLDSGRRHQLELKVTTVALTDLTPAAVEEPEGDDGSPISFLFRQFLSLTGYGRKEYRTVSRPFALSELDTAPARP